MKKIALIPLLAAATVAVLAIVSFSPAPDYYYGEWTPYYMERADLEMSVKMENISREMSDPGKIYVYGDYIFVNEKYKGVHVIDNSNPRTPEKVAFIIAPGCIDMAIRENVMYLDNAVDFVAFDLVTEKEIARIADYFPERPSPDGYYDYNNRPEDMILVGWKKSSDQ